MSKPLASSGRAAGPQAAAGDHRRNKQIEHETYRREQFGVSPQRARASPRRNVEFLIRAPMSSEITRRCPSERASQSMRGGGLEAR